MIDGCGVHGDHPAGSCGLPIDAVLTIDPQSGHCVIPASKLQEIRFIRLGRAIYDAALLETARRIDDIWETVERERKFEQMQIWMNAQALRRRYDGK